MRPIRLWDPILDTHAAESRAFNAAVPPSLNGGEPPDLDTPDGVRAARASVLDLGDPRPEAVDRIVVGPAGRARVRVLVPDVEVRGAYLDIHGGGWYLGSAAMGDQHNWRLANDAGLAVVSVDYRLAPEHPYPAAPDDCEAAAAWLLDAGLTEFGTDKLLVGGGSAGAHLAVVTLLRMRDRHDALGRIAGANLMYGVYDLAPQAPGRDPQLGPESSMVRAFVGSVPPEKRTDPDISPLYADLDGMPPALFTVGALDFVYEETLRLALRWAAAGREAHLAVYPESIHAFNGLPTAMAEAANLTIVEFLRMRVGP